MPTVVVAPRPWARWLTGLAWLGSAVWIWATRAGTLLAGHPAYAVLVTAGALVGLLLIVSAVRARPADGPPWRRVLGRVVGIVVTLLLVSTLVWLRPFAAAPSAVDAMAGSEAVVVTSTATRITLTPTAAEPTVGLVFQPGARLDPRAYVPLLSRLSAEGYLVVVVKQPLAIVFTALSAPDGIIADHPEIRAWATGGHSLGGVGASAYAADHADQVDGLLLWASFPLGSLADRTDLRVVSVSGTADGLATPADIEESRVDLPASAEFVAVDGAVHAFFGDYGSQPGDGTPTVSRDQAQDEIVEASLALLSLGSPSDRDDLG